MGGGLDADEGEGYSPMYQLYGSTCHPAIGRDFFF